MWVPSGKKARAAANLAALNVLVDLAVSGQQPTADQQQTLGAWSSWGAIPEVFEPGREGWESIAADVRAVMSDAEYDAARATTLNAHYTDPSVAASMWRAFSQAGLHEGTVLEPGCGSGNFMLLAPHGLNMVGIELDPTSAKIAAYLNPQAQVRAEGFERTRFTSESGSFHGAIGNVPFGGFSLHDPIDNPQNLSIHNHFIAKTVKHLAPGGYAFLLTSSFTMDAKRSTARAHIAKYADLVGAVRLPTGAMERVSGTEVVTDVLILRRRESGTTTTTPDWLNAKHQIGVDAEGDAVFANDYWAAHPENVLGEMSLRNGMYGSTTLTVTGPRDVPTLAGRLQAIIEQARADLPYSPGPVSAAALETKAGLLVPNPVIKDLIPGHIRVAGEGFQAWSGTSWELVKLPANRAPETRALLGLRDEAAAVIATQREADTSVAQREAARARLGRAYDTYVAAHGPINRYTLSNPKAPTQKAIEKVLRDQTSAWRKGLPDDLPEEERANLAPSDDQLAEWAADITPSDPIKVQTHLPLALRQDPSFGLVMALESFDDDTQTAVKTAFFTRDVLSQVPERTHADTPADAIAVSLEETRRVDVERIAELLGCTPEDARVQLTGLVFTDHITGELEAATTYLSGDVRAKHAEVSALVADGRTDLEPNLAALRAAMPPIIPLEKVTIRPGVPWIDAEYLTQFCEDIFGVTIHAELTPGGGTWALLSKPAKSLVDPAIEMKYGTAKRSVADLWEAAINNSAVTISKEVERMRPDGTYYTSRVTDTVATKAAREKVAAITAAFSAWVHTEPARASHLEVLYNARFNSYVAPDYAVAGRALQFPGLSAAITPHPYQRSAVARVLAEPGTLLDHVVGAGKTGSMILSTMELRRTGVANKPWIVVPDHLVEQTAAAFATWYPDSHVMTIPTGASPAERRTAVARSAAGDWDAVICPLHVFENIPLDPERTSRWASEQVDTLREQLSQVATSDPGSKAGRRDSTVKRIEAQIKTIEKRFAAQTDNKDVGLTFESTGCDYLFVDEAHNYKNLARVSDYRELACVPGSKRATDLDWKLRALRESKVEAATRAGMDTSTYIPAVATFATGTPVANNLSEMWVMQHYLAPHVLDSIGLTNVNAWAQQFTENVTKMEIGPDGVTWRMRARVAGVVNAPELIALADRYTDRVTRERIPAQLPTLATGERMLMRRPASQEVKEYIAGLAYRANNMDPDPSVDNLLKITHEGRMIALDPRTLGLSAEPDGGRISAVADQISRIYDSSKANRYRDHAGADHPTPGALQLVFCDRSTPKGDGSFTVYEALASQLAERGLPRERIAFIHDATDDLSRANLFQRCRTGEIAVLIGSTEKMGTGTNVQDRAIALHHMDCPWRPADLEQREGRIVRQGNQNEQVEVLNYVTEGTYDAVMWQIVARKASFIAKTKQAGPDRTLTDVEDDMTISAAAASAIATGDPRIIERAELMETVGSLTALRDGHYNQTGQARTSAAIARMSVEQATGALAQVQAVLSQRQPSRTPATATGSPLADRTAAGEHVITTALASAPRLRDGVTIDLLTYEGAAFTLRASHRTGLDGAARALHFLEAKGCSEISTVLDDHPSTWAPVGIAIRIENLTNGLHSRSLTLQQTITTKTELAAQLSDVAATPFEREAELIDAQARLDVIDNDLQMAAATGAVTATGGLEVITGADLRAIVPAMDHKGRIENHERDHLLPGDVVRGLTASKSTLFTIVSVPQGPNAWQGLKATPYEEPDTPPIPLGADKVELVSRPALLLTPTQRWLLDNNMELRSGPRSGLGRGHNVIATRGDQITTGKILSTEGPSYRPTSYIIATSDGPVQVDANEATTIQAIYERSAERSYEPGTPSARVGASLTRDITMPTGSIIPVGTTVTLDPTRNSRALSHSLRTADGAPVNTTYAALRAEAKDAWTVTTTNLTPAELATHLAQTGEATLASLREGDVVNSRDLDPKARLDREVRVLNTPSPWADKIDLTYADIQGGPEQQVTRMGNNPITLVTRQAASLTALEARHLTHPEGSVMPLSSVSPGTTVTVWIDPEKGRPRLATGVFKGTREKRVTNGTYSRLATVGTIVEPDGSTIDHEVNDPAFTKAEPESNPPGSAVATTPQLSVQWPAAPPSFASYPPPGL